MNLAGNPIAAKPRRRLDVMPRAGIFPTVIFRSIVFRTIILRTAIGCALAALMILPVLAQMDSNERAFPQSKDAIEKALKSMQPALAGRLPVLDGFADSEHSLERYQRGYYQAEVQVSSAPAGGSVVRISVKVTAWYSDPVGSRSGYQLLRSNGRLEADLLDQLREQIAKFAPETGTPKRVEATARPASSAPAPVALPVPTSPAPLTSVPTTSAPTASRPSDQNPATPSPSPFTQSLAARENTVPRPSMASIPNKTDAHMQAEVESLEEILKNQAHPKNLVAVKKSGTPVVSTPSLTAKPLFLASMHDEFEMLDFNPDWVHVRVSGLSRGWIWRNSLEMPEGIPDTAGQSGPSPSPAADLFHVIREETAAFPGDWQPLRGKSVKIISVQKVDEHNEGGPQDKLEYAKFLLDKNFAELKAKPQELAGIVLIFDSADGGMIAATVATIQQWKAGTMTDAALWHNCFFDPPETFNAAGSSGAQ